MVDLILMAIFCLVSVAIIVISRIMSKKVKKNCSLRIEAVVEDREAHHGYQRNHRDHRDIYGYDYNGVHYKSGAKSRLGQKAVGQKQILFIAPANPQDIYRKEDLLLPRFMLFLGIVMFVDTFFYLIQIIAAMI